MTTYIHMLIRNNCLHFFLSDHIVGSYNVLDYHDEARDEVLKTERELYSKVWI